MTFWVLVAAYLIGSIPFGLMLTRAAGLGDIRRIGSGNIGATNVLRTGHKGLAAATLLLDAGKGAAAVLALPSPAPAAVAVVVGHCAPVWLRFRGGKGVATGFGAFYGLDWRLCAIACAVWLAVASLTRRSSAAALAGTLSAPLTSLLLPRVPTWPVVLVAALIWLRHRGNIARLLDGTEPRIGARA